MHTLRVVSVALTLVAAAGAQIPIIPLPTRGMMSALPAGVLMSSGGPIQKKAAGLPITTLTPFATPSNQPGDIAWYSVQAIMAWLTNPTTTTPINVTQIQIDAMSSGNDALPLLHHGSEFWVSQGNQVGWAVLVMSVEGDPQLGDAVMGYYFKNPLFPQQLRRGIYYEFLPQDFPTATMPRDLDVAMGMLEDNHGRLTGGGPPVINRIYFSLTPASAQLLYAELQAASAPLLHVTDVPYNPPAPGWYTGATIFVAEFASGTCTGVKVCEDWQSLQIEQGDDIDGLAVGNAQALQLPDGTFDQLVPGTRQYVFSLSAPLNGNELLVAADVGVTAPGVHTQGALRGNDGDQLLGGTTGSLHAHRRVLCALDPEVGGLGASAYGEPDDHGAPDQAHSLSLSLAVQNVAPFAQSYPTDQFTVRGVVSGWGGWTPEDSLFWLRMEVVGGPLDAFTTYFGPWSRTAADGYGVFTQALPPVPWLGIWADPEQQPGPGIPVIPNMNRCRFSVYQVGVSQSHPPTESFRSLVHRHM